MKTLGSSYSGPFSQCVFLPEATRSPSVLCVCVCVLLIFKNFSSMNLYKVLMRLVMAVYYGGNKTWRQLDKRTRRLTCFLVSPLQAKPLQQEVHKEVPDSGRALQGAAAHRLLPQDGVQAGHRAGGERRGRQAALRHALAGLHAVSAPSFPLQLLLAHQLYT